RIFGQLRNVEGLSYSAGSQFAAHPVDKYAELSVSATFKPENRDRVRKGVREAIDKLVKEGVTAAELEEAKKGWLQDRQVARSRDTTLAAMLRDGLFYNRTLARQADLERRVAALTVEEVNRALRAHVDPARFYIVEAGDFKK